jgi:magnesium transporter
MCYNKSMITYYYRTMKAETLEVVDALRKGTWVHAEDPTEEELDTLAETLGLDRDLLTDAVDQNEVPRFEHEQEVAYFFARFPHKKSLELGTASMLIAVTPTAVVTVSRQHPSFIDKYIENRTPCYTTQRTKLFLLLVDAINKRYRSNLVSIRREIQKSKVNLRQIRNRDIVRLVELESSLNDFIGALVPTSSTLRTILSGSYLQLYEEDRDMIEDIQLENGQQVEAAKTGLKTIQNIRDAYTAIVTNNLNSVIKLLTALTIILTIPTVIGSLYGMNVVLPFADSPHAFFGIAFTAAAAMAVAAFVFVKRDWM